jgi:hypothetical protein
VLTAADARRHPQCGSLATPRLIDAMRVSPLLFGIAALARLAAGQQLVIPDSQNFVNSNSTTVAWPAAAAGGRVQWLYDSTHFTNAGVTGPITLTRLRFRAADGVRVVGGHVFSNVVLQLGTAAVDHASASTTYAANQGVMRPPSAPFNLTLQSVNGAIPNQTLVDLDLLGLGIPFVYDPTLGSDLLIDFTFPAGGPIPSTNLAAQATSSVAAQRASRVSGPLAGPGVASPAAAVVLVDFTGPGGYAAPVGAHAESIGASCGVGAQSFYQAFGNEPFDLRGPGRSLLLVPDPSAAPTRYHVTAGTQAPDLSPKALGGGPPNTTDDGVVQIAPGFTFHFPGGSTTIFSACTNGYVWLGSNTVGDFSPTLLEVLESMARLMPYWQDHHAGRNASLLPDAGMYVHADLSGGPGNGRVTVTWKEIGQFAGGAVAGNCVNTFQCRMWENGNVEFRYGAMNSWLGGGGFVGFSRGGTTSNLAVDPGSRDLSHEVPFSTAPEGAANGGALRLSISAQPALSSTGTPIGLTLTIANLPATTVAAAVVLGFSGLRPGIPLPLGAPGCVQSIVAPVALQSVAAPGPSWTTGPLILPPGTSPDGGRWMGVSLYTQGATLDNNGGVVSAYSTNAILLTLGLL